MQFGPVEVEPQRFSRVRGRWPFVCGIAAASMCLLVVMELIRAGDGRSHAEHRGVLETRRTTSSSLKQECMCTRCRRSAPGDKLYCSDVMTTCKDGSAPAADEVFVKCANLGSEDEDEEEGGSTGSSGEGGGGGIDGRGQAGAVDGADGSGGEVHVGAKTSEEDTGPCREEEAAHIAAAYAAGEKAGEEREKKIMAEAAAARERRKQEEKERNETEIEIASTEAQANAEEARARAEEEAAAAEEKRKQEEAERIKKEEAERAAEAAEEQQKEAQRAEAEKKRMELERAAAEAAAAKAEVEAAEKKRIDDEKAAARAIEAPRQNCEDIPAYDMDAWLECEMAQQEVAERKQQGVQADAVTEEGEKGGKDGGAKEEQPLAPQNCEDLLDLDAWLECEESRRQ